MSLARKRERGTRDAMLISLARDEDEEGDKERSMFIEGTSDKRPRRQTLGVVDGVVVEKR